MVKPDPYFVEAAGRVLDVLDLFGRCAEVSLADVSRELGMVKSTAFRFLYTLERKGYVERIDGGRAYRRRTSRRIGFLSISSSIPFVAEVEAGIAAEFARAGHELLIRHHEFEPRLAVDVVENLLASGIALLLCYNPDEHISHVIADRCAEAHTPVVAITFPVPGAHLFGINNFRAGLAGGEGLGAHLARQWKGALERLLIIDIPGSSPAQQARLTGMLEGLRRHVEVPDQAVLHLQIDRRETNARVLMSRFLERNPRLRHIAVLCYNDLNALGAAEAAEAAGRSGHVRIVSQGAVREVRDELRRPGSALWGAVAHFPERFGARLAPIAQRMLRGETVPATIYAEHVLLTRANISQYYESGT
jgi:ABC-type sugar transport system substrate-binding protein